MDGLNTLTAKQEGFAQSIADGASQADAYRTNYSAERMSSKSVWEKASELSANVKVKARLDVLRQALSDKQLWTRADSVSTLRKIAESDGADGAPAAAKVSAVKELNAMNGFNEPARSEVTHKGLAAILLEAVDDNGES